LGEERLTARNGKNRTLRPKISRLKENAPEFDYSSFYVTTGTGTPGCLVAQDLALLTKVRTLIHQEISLLTVLYFPFRARTPMNLFLRFSWIPPSASFSQRVEAAKLACPEFDHLALVTQS
jgi:hypothetical protein